MLQLDVGGRKSEARIAPLRSMNTPPTEITSGCWPGKPQCPLPAENTTTIPPATAAVADVPAPVAAPPGHLAGPEALA